MAGMKKWALICTAALMVASPLSGCSMYKLEELRHTTMSGSPFQNELAKLYMDFASDEEKQYDWNSSWYFADKGLSLAYGKEAGPEELENWNIPAAALPDLQKARTSLMAVLTADVMRNVPARAAAAQFFFDCWVEQQEEGWQDEDIAYCRDNLMKALEDLHAPGARHVASVPSKKPVTKVTLKEEQLEAAAEKPVAENPVVIAESKPVPEESVQKKEEKPVEKEPVAKMTESPKAKEESKASSEHMTSESTDDTAAEGITIDKAEKKPAMKAMPEPVKEFPAKDTKKTSEKPKDKAKDKKDGKDAGDNVTETTSYAVFFETNKAQVSEPGMNVITEIIKSLNGASNYAVILHTSKDRPGMAAERIHVVRKLLTAGGVKESAIKVASGTAEVETGKTVSRRVEIFLNE